MHKEIERKYAINYFPEDMKINSVVYIEQSSIYRDFNTMIRIRKIQDELNNNTYYVYTLKTKGEALDKSQSIAEKYEIENYITESEYEELLKTKIGNTIKKTRIIVPIENNLKVEIDVFYDYLENHLTAEIEFENVEAAKSFKKPDWLGEELGYKELSNGKLSRMNRKEFESKVSKEFLDNNKKLIHQLKEFNQSIKLKI